MDFRQINAENERMFAEGKFDGMKSVYIKDYTPTERTREKPFKLSDSLVKQTTIACVIANRESRSIALNFASAYHPGGGYLTGARAQEESLCRASGLYYTLRDVTAFYDDNKRGGVEYTDGMIHSENVPVVRDDFGKAPDTPVLCDFLTVPAVNRHKAHAIPREQTNLTMERRINKIVSYCAETDCGTVILGAFGCGVFGNYQNEVLPMFERAINRFGGDKKYIFAIP